MNKKVVTFLSLFSLVLILSIYYVISPFGNNIDPNNGLNVNVQVNNENDEYIQDYHKPASCYCCSRCRFV